MDSFANGNLPNTGTRDKVVVKILKPQLHYHNDYYL